MSQLSSPLRQYGTPYRWVICTLLFLATTCNYIDRQVLGILAPELQREFGWSEVLYGHIVTSFQVAYAVGLASSGWFIDRLGSRYGLSIAVFLWSVAAVAHGFARTAGHFLMARFGLGIAESANFPAAIKTVAEWFPERERPFAIGVFNCGSNVGAIIAPLVVPVLAIHYGWRSAFIVLGAFGFVWLVLAKIFFCEAPKASPNAAGEIRCPAFRDVVTWRSTWEFAAAKFLTDPVWWFYLYWTPKYLHSRFGLELMSLGMPLVIIYVAADVGSIGGGWLSGWLARRGLPDRAARLRVLFLCSTAAMLVLALAYVESLYSAVLLLSLAAAAHQGWSANLFAAASAAVPKEGVASVIGIGGTAGAVGGIVLAEVTGHVLEYTGSYVPLFVVCSSAYLVAWLIIRLSYLRVPCDSH